MQNGIENIVYTCIFALVGVILLCSFAIPILADLLRDLGQFYLQYVPIGGMIVVVLIIVLVSMIVPRASDR